MSDLVGPALGLSLCISNRFLGDIELLFCRLSLNVRVQFIFSQTIWWASVDSVEFRGKAGLQCWDELDWSE